MAETTEIPLVSGCTISDTKNESGTVLTTIVVPSGTHAGTYTSSAPTIATAAGEAKALAGPSAVTKIYVNAANTIIAMDTTKTL